MSVTQFMSCHLFDNKLLPMDANLCKIILCLKYLSVCKKRHRGKIIVSAANQDRHLDLKHPVYDLLVM